MLKRLQLEMEKAKQANKEKSRFLANISHEIRTPLNAIVGFSSMLDKVDDEEQKKMMVRHINDASKSLMDLVEGVLDFSRIESGQVKIKQSRVDLRSLLASIEGMFSLQASKKGVKYTTNIAGNIPRCVVGDTQRLRQVLVNLIGNAVKFTDEGEVNITVEMDDFDKNKSMIRFDVSDTGPGIKGRVQGAIFERFKQADDSARRLHGGTGLGTAIAKNLVELMGGEIGLKSTYGKGSCFWFMVPLSTYTSDGAQPEPVDEPLGEEKAITPCGLSRVLIAEDSEINRYVYFSMFQYFGIDAEYVETGAAALQRLQEKHFDLLILDMQMPGMSGVDVLNRYYAVTPDRDRVPVAVISGDATEDVRQECERLGVKAFLAKPVGVDEMRELLGHYMSLDMHNRAAGV